MVYYGNELYHHGILGQKWGVRRYQNADGSYTEAGRKRYGVNGEKTITVVKRTANKATGSISNTAKKVKDKINGMTPEQKATAKKVAVGVGVAALTIGAAALYAKNPAVSEAVNSMASKTITSIGSVAKSGKSHLVGRTANFIQTQKGTVAGKINSGKIKLGMTARYMAKDAYSNAKSGVREGIVNAPKKVVKATVEGATIMAATKMLDSMVGTENVDNYIKAYNAYNKKNKINLNATRLSNDEDDDD